MASKALVPTHKQVRAPQQSRRRRAPPVTSPVHTIPHTGDALSRKGHVAEDVHRAMPLFVLSMSVCSASQWDTKHDDAHTHTPHIHIQTTSTPAGTAAGTVSSAVLPPRAAASPVGTSGARGSIGSQGSVVAAAAAAVCVMLRVCIQRVFCV